MEKVNLFVPGRVSIIGELSDFVSDYIEQNELIIPGEVIAGGIDKGIYAVATKASNFEFYFKDKSIVVDMNMDKLSDIAKSDNFFSYVCSVAYIMKKTYDVGGVSVKVRHMSLPIQKGLSSSASACVLTVKAFNFLYKLNLKFDEIMELAYQAERYALSMCGRLDQICAKGLGMSHIVFHKDKLDVNDVEIGSELNFVISDLNGFKDTKKILGTLNNCFPFPKNEIEEKVRKTLCEDNKYLVNEALKAIKEGNREELGLILSKWQDNLDKSGGVLTDALEGPILHKVMSDKIIREVSYGAKGTGSNGDGSIVILAKDRECQNKIVEYLNTEYKMKPFIFNVNGTYKVKRSIVLNSCNLEMLKMLDSLGMEEIIVIKNDNNDISYKDLDDNEFDKLSDNEKEDYIKLQRCLEKTTIIDFDELIDIINSQVSLLISGSFLEEQCRNMLKNFNDKNVIEIKNIDNLNAFDKMVFVK